MMATPDSARIRRPSSTLVPASRTTSGTVTPTSLERLDDALGHPVAAVDAGEDVDEDRLDILVAQHRAERLRHPLGRGAAADVEEVRGLAAGELDHVHRRHGEAGAVDDAADIAVEADIGEAAVGGEGLARVFLALVAQLGDVRAGGTARSRRRTSWRRARRDRRRLVTTSGLISSMVAS